MTSSPERALGARVASDQAASALTRSRSHIIKEPAMNRTNRILPTYTGDVSGACSALYELGGMVVIHDP